MEVKPLLFLIFNLVSSYLADENLTFKNVKVNLSGSCYFSNYEMPNLTISQASNLGELLKNYPLGKCVEIVNQTIPVLYKYSISNIDVQLLDITNCGISELQPGAFKNSSIAQIFIDDNEELSTIKRGVFDHVSGLEQLFLRRNGIKYIEKGAFENVHASHVDLRDNQLEEIPPGVFNNISVAFLDLRRNKIKRILRGTFSYSLVSTLCLEDNLIEDIALGSFENTPSLAYLTLGKNSLTQIGRGIFGEGSRLRMDSVILEYNNIKSIDIGAFEGCSFLLLSLSHNKLEEVKKGTFRGSNINELLLFNNSIKNVESGAFDVGNLSTIDLGKNTLRIIRRGTFNNGNILKINLYDNDIEEIEAGAFNSNSTEIYLQDAKLDEGSKSYIKSLPNVYVNSNYFRVSRYYLH